jgi:3-phenylpropionate/trans-cinnamate dioxygenase ferredoxin component
MLEISQATRPWCVQPDNHAMADFVEIMSPGRIAPGSGTRVAFAEHCAVALFNIEGTLFAIDDLCVRCGSSLAGGKLHGSIVACCGCDWRYDVTTGCVNEIPALRIDTFETKIVDGRIMIATAATADTPIRSRH